MKAIAEDENITGVNFVIEEALVEFCPLIFSPVIRMMAFTLILGLLAQPTIA